MLHFHLYCETTLTCQGKTTGIGEDAVPYANDKGMFVCDGLGGSAAVPVIGLDEAGTFDLYQAFQNVCAVMDWNPENQELLNYFQDSFSGLFSEEMKRMCETQQIRQMKKSGYVGSRVLGLILTEYLLCEADGKSPQECADEIRSILPLRFPKLWKSLHLRFADVSFSRMETGGTTLCSAFYSETAETAEVCFLSSGDSRAYVLDKEGGFRQAVDDQGNENGGMDSLVSLRRCQTDSLEISRKAKIYTKPVIVICMSDGFYNSFFGFDGFSSTPLYMEGMFLNLLVQSQSKEEFYQYLTAFFEDKTIVDDSHTFSMTAFGFETFEELRQFAEERLKSLYATYALDELPGDILTKDYAKTAETRRRDLIQEKREDFFRIYLETPGVKEYCEKQAKVRPEVQQQFRDKLFLNEVEDEMEKFVCENYVGLPLPVNIRKELEKKIQKLGKEQELLKKICISFLKNVRAKKYSKSFSESSNLSDLMKEAQNTANLREEWKKGNRCLSNLDGEESVQEIVKQLLEKQYELSQLEEQERQRYQALYQDYHKYQKKMQENEKQLRKYPLLYWEEHAVSVPGAEEAVTAFFQQDEQLSQLEEYARAQKDIFSRYLESYLSDVSDQKRQLVRRTGWK